jgi:hypothetical protein
VKRSLCYVLYLYEGKGLHRHISPPQVSFFVDVFILDFFWRWRRKVLHTQGQSEAYLLVLIAHGVVLMRYQDVANKDAGKLLGLTNTCGTLVGVVGNVATGRLAASRHGYTAVFGITSALYATSAVTWLLFMKGQPIQFSNLATE